MLKIQNQDDWIERARNVLPAAGFGNFDPSVIIREGHGARVIDENGREFVDYLIGSGPMLLGHGHPEVLEVVFEQLPKGMTFFANNAAAIELAETICEAVPCAETLRYVSSGGEADMFAIRLARAFTGRNKILKFEGGYHGMSSEAQMSLAPEKMMNFPSAVPDSAGIPDSVQVEVLVSPFNDPDFIRSLLLEHGNEIAGIIVEPLQRIVPAEPGFLELLRSEADRYGIVLIFDEIVTGFRCAYGGMQELSGVIPDVCTLGKVIGGGFPLAAIAGRKEILAHFDKQTVGSDRWLMQLGTLSGNPVASVAGLKTLEILHRDGQYDRLRENGRKIMTMLQSALAEIGSDFTIVGDPTLFDVVFGSSQVRNYRDVFNSDKMCSDHFNNVLRANGILKSPGKIYPCLALTDEDLAVTQSAIQAAAAAISNA